MENAVAQLVVTGVSVALNLLVSVLVTLVFKVLKDLKEQVKERKDEIKEVKEDLLGRMNETRQDVRDLRDRQDQASERHTEALRRVLDSLPQTYVDREDYIRTMASQDKKTDRVLAAVLDIQKDFQAHIVKERANEI